jgi:DASH complex subunit DAD2
MPPRATNILPSSASALRQPSLGNPAASSQSSTLLTSRIAAKKAELEHLKSRRDLSGALAAQMQTLEEKLASLRDGTEGMLNLPMW